MPANATWSERGPITGTDGGANTVILKLLEAVFEPSLAEIVMTLCPNNPQRVAMVSVRFVPLPDRDRSVSLTRLVLLECVEMTSDSTGVSGSETENETATVESAEGAATSAIGEITGGWFVALRTCTSQLRVFQSFAVGSVRTSGVGS